MSAIRWKFSGLMFLGVLINYLDRVNISHTIFLMSRDLNLSLTEQGLILSAFSWGYVSFMLPGGWMVDRFGPRIMNALSCFLWSAFTGVTALASNFVTLLSLRILLGIAEAPIFPGNAKVVAMYFPVQERGRATAIFDAGSYIGAALAGPFIVTIMLAWGWKICFIMCSIVGIAWSVFWIYYYPNLDQETASVTNKKVDTVGVHRVPPHLTLNWFHLLSHRKVLGISFGFFSYNYLKSFFLTWFPTYLVQQRDFTILNVGLISFIPPACAVLGELTAGFITDKMIHRGVSVTVARKAPICIGLLLSSIVIFAAFVNQNWLVVVLLSLSYASLISASAGIWAIPADIAPSKDLVGSIGGIQNTFSNLAGIIAPIVTAILYSHTGSFLWPLLVSGLLTICGAMSYWFIVGNLTPLSVKSLGQA